MPVWLKYRGVMKMSKRQRRLPTFEILEDRYTPAGTVTGSFANGTWTLIGDADANSIHINPTLASNLFTVTGLNGTAVAGVTNAENVTHIVVKLRGGDDVVGVINTALVGQLLGNLTIDGGSGANLVEIDGFQMKNLSITNGTNNSGPDALYLRDSVIQKN